MIAFSIQFLLSAYLLSPLVAQAADNFLWNQLTPSQDLQWVPCYSIFQCTRLEVPFDYSDPNVGTAALAVIRLPANVSGTDYQGPILFNPGGPGGSGVDSLVENAANFQVVFGSELTKYDIVSFDPRGVRYSTPQASFFQTQVERDLWNAGSAHLLGAIAAQRDTSQILKYLTTDNVARDMLLMTQKFGFEKLKYYGTSYGSVIGATFAAMFPDKIERILIDGVVDPEAWFSANLTIESTDTDKALQTFFDGCAAAGPDLCAFYKPTAAEVAERLTTLTESVRRTPIPALASTGYGLVDYSLLRNTIFKSLYAPYEWFPALAQGMAALERGDGTTLYSISLQQGTPFQDDCTTNSTATPTDDAAIAIQCGDAVEVKDSVQEVTDFYRNAARTSKFAEFFVGSSRVSCSGWQVYREDRFNGPVAAANTSFPLLLTTTSADPVTPKAGALRVQAAFPGSGLLTQDSPGHTSNTAPSLCTIGYFRQYFFNGTLPPPGTVCPVEVPLFGAPANFTSKRALSADDKEVLAAMKAISESLLSVIGTSKFRI
ncbi:Alpha/Beta hydrolase protein [Mycena olivaceomarginata]|nr:Alpha/Beta hydrolase protein [Mycena olivaceomarginata]